ncbi:DNA polymerase delta subunit 3-like isoform X2 [Apis laboriosa]|nr:DNA polymerase delta subunit 3-like isoform X2 [Apis laboriosa]
MLEVHVNIAKQILWEFWQKYKKEKEFVCTFLLMGILYDNGMHVEIVKEKDLITSKEKYSKIISEHIYSLQKILPEIQLLGNTENGDIKFSAIKCIENNERNDEEMHIFRWGPISSEIQFAPQEEAQSISESNEEKKIISPEKKKQTVIKKNERKGFDNLFGKVINKQKNLYTSSIEEMNIESSDIKETSKNVLKSTKEIIQKDKLNNCLQSNENQTEAVESPNKKNSINSIQKKITEEKIIFRNNKQKNIRGKKRSQSKDLNNTTKKQKCITIHGDSNNTESSNDEQELELPISPENLSSSISKDSKSPPQMKFENGKRKVLKIVDKTFEEDGFLVTKKVHVYESCSEDESEILAKKSMIPESHLEFKGKKNTKQTTLMNFFKKS